MTPWHALTHTWRDASRVRRRVVLSTVVGIAFLTVIVTLVGVRHRSPSPSIVTPPWVYGNVHARYSLIEYADLECPYCKAYFPVLKAWIDAHPEVNWQWQHRPLAMHEPAATRDAWWAECAGRTNGNEGFWHAVAWIYANTRGNGEGVPASADFPETSPKLKACLQNPDVGKAVQAQTEAAGRAGIDATPMVKLLDRSSGKAIVLAGAIEGDALLSAMDWLADASPTQAPPTSTAVSPRTRIDSSSDTP
ncbi:DSBA-like thioredoxin domain protein [Burkholderia thailandensis MSMB121]|uniref:DsbA family protein n=1 Tax=Burkholderia humptydooensis TaxID=430531 RepID=UPI000327FBDD|nr:thioredoxin domain-containing protein [Burkholderia humptydooensis]AGK47132.1 DSBA-like thioredoxin domain protein [Burkholderia thailandensis MSMB121]ATF37215.1 disulfide bond formation protein DsbA [Burkholderia thailandensis]KST74587.1 disulfide bond formation protein DsbA [Burkholderia humptydooensis]